MNTPILCYFGLPWMCFLHRHLLFHVSGPFPRARRHVLFDRIISPPSYLRHSRSLSLNTNRRVFHLPQISLQNHKTIVLV
ncbi:hypothetical protein BS17DRAFT_852048 [Gyrodon lividus]|nr:hypothetical protein BS17DRAFT_852048 [Gyrodon lividus]